VAVEKVFRDDLTGEYVPKGSLMVFRVGLLSDRPEDCERIDIGPGSHGRPISELVTLFGERRQELTDGDTAPA
jgi:hypothetical protein